MTKIAGNYFFAYIMRTQVKLQLKTNQFYTNKGKITSWITLKINHKLTKTYK